MANPAKMGTVGITRRVRGGALLRGALIALFFGPACGRVADVLNDPPPGVDGGVDGGSGRTGSGALGDGGPGTGARGAGSTGNTAGGGSYEDGGPVRGAGGATGTGGPAVSIEGGIHPSREGGGPPSGPIGEPTASNGSAYDPHREERTALLHQYCSLLEKYPCRTFNGASGQPYPVNAPTDEKIAVCEQSMAIYAYKQTVAGCWNEWVRAAKCDATLDFTCPCGAGEECLIPNSIEAFDGRTGNIPAGPCFEERTAYSDCYAKLNEPFGWGDPIEGSRARVEWSEAPGYGCMVYPHTGDTSVGYSLKCDGVPGGPYVCECEVNGQQFVDFLTVLGAERHLAKDCKSVAEDIANGWCINSLDCCVSFRNPNSGVQECGCTADPHGPDDEPLHLVGSPSCEALANSLAGTIVDICPQYARAN